MKPPPPKITEDIINGIPLKSVRDGSLNVRPYPSGEKVVTNILPTPNDVKWTDYEVLEYWNMHYPPIQVYKPEGMKHPLYSENMDQELILQYEVPAHIYHTMQDPLELTRFGMDTTMDNDLCIPTIWFTVNNKKAPIIGWVVEFFDRLWYITDNRDDTVVFPNTFVVTCNKYHVRMYHPTIPYGPHSNA